MTPDKILLLVLQVSIMLTVFGFGLTATFSDATYLLRTPKLLLRTVVSMNVIMPCIAVLIVSFLALPYEVNFALAALTLSPVPPMLQKSQIDAGGRREYVVGLLVAMSLLAIAIVPAAVAIFAHLYGRPATLSPLTVAKIMTMTVLAPLLVALLIAKWFPAVEKAAGKIMTIASISLLLSSVLILYGLWPTVREFIGNGVVLMLAVLAALGLGVGHLMGGPRAADRTVLAMSTSSRHPAVALAIATSGPLGAPKHELAIIVMYLIIATIIGIPYKRWRERPSAGTR
jgi:bile acid:Na+ symporter, BASS family